METRSITVKIDDSQLEYFDTNATVENLITYLHGCNLMLDTINGTPNWNFHKIKITQGKSRYEFPYEINESEYIHDYLCRALNVEDLSTKNKAKFDSVHCEYEYDNVNVVSNALRFGFVEISLIKTLRVPNDGCIYNLPANLGYFPLCEKDGVVYIPMHLDEALWFNFNEKTYPTKHCAIKIGCGEINAISGEPYVETILNDKPQDYVTIPDQPWLDGVNYGEGVIRQFVATTSQKTIEHQITGESSNIIKITVYPKKENQFDVYYLDESNMYQRLNTFQKIYNLKLHSVDNCLYVVDAPSKLRLSEYCDETDTINIGTRHLSSEMCDLYIRVKTMITYKYIHIGPYDTVRELCRRIESEMPVRELYFCTNNLAGEHQIITPLSKWRWQMIKNLNMSKKDHIFNYYSLRGGGSVPNTNVDLGLGVGGLIQQKIYPARKKSYQFNIVGRKTITIRILNPNQWKEWTGVDAPHRPIDFRTYLSKKIPFYTLHDQHKASIEATPVTKSLQPADNYTATITTSATYCPYAASHNYSGSTYHPYTVKDTHSASTTSATPMEKTKLISTHPLSYYTYHPDKNYSNDSNNTSSSYRGTRKCCILY